MTWGEKIYQILHEAQRPLSAREIGEKVAGGSEGTKDPLQVIASLRVYLSYYKRGGSLGYIRFNQCKGFYYLRHWSKNKTVINHRKFNPISKSYE